MSIRPSSLAVKGAKYNRKNGEGDKTLDRLQQVPKGVAEIVGSFSSQLQPVNTTSTPTSTPKQLQPSGPGQSPGINYSKTITPTTFTPAEPDPDKSKYWKQPVTGSNEDLVVIHVCDENQKLSKDFCCKRDILVTHMKYFEKFLAENENGYDDIDISVHCDVEIFEWLMTYIHDPECIPQIDKSIIVSILISSEFLQMDTLVDICVNHVATNLNEIIKLPIDLSCISEKLVNKIAYVAHPKTLSETKDRKDKILTKLYKRRVELDFSRKGSTSKGVSSNNSFRTIAASLTCCRHCGCVYLDNYVGYLNCRSSPPTINFRGQLASRHSSIAGWSLTSYLKTLHSGGMGWDSIYWHVWAACIVFRVENIMISALEVDRYTVESDGLLIRGSVVKDMDGDDSVSNIDVTAAAGGGGNGASAGGSLAKPPLVPKVPLTFSLAVEDDCKICGAAHEMLSYKLLVSRLEDSRSYNSAMPNNATCTLNPNRPPEVLTLEIFDLICTQMKFIVNLPHKQLIVNTMKVMVDSAKQPQDSLQPLDFGEILWGCPVEGGGAGGGEEGGERLRGRSPAARSRSMEPRKANSLKKTATAAAGGGSGGGAGGGAAGSGGNSDVNDSGSDSEVVKGERRSRSSSVTMGTRTSSMKQLLTKTTSSAKERSVSVGPKGGNGSFDPFTRNQLTVLLALPPDVRQKVLSSRGPVYGVWNTAHPLQVLAPQHEDMLVTISESSLSDNKKLEWELDIMREYDEKRMEKFERFLVSKRNTQIDNYFAHQKSKGRSGRSGGNFPSKADYYKDRGRQTYK